MTLRSGLCSVTLRASSADEVLRVAEQAHVEGIEWGADVHVLPGAPDASALAHRCRDTGIDCPSYGSYISCGEGRAEVEVTGVLDTAEALGARLVRIWLELGVEPDALATDRRRIADEARIVAVAAAARSLDVAVEFHAWTLTEQAQSAVAFLDEVGADNLYSYWQPIAGLDDEDLRASLATVVPRLAHVHVFWRDYSDRRPLVEAAHLWPELLASARDAPARPDDDRFAFLEFVRDDDPAQVVRDARVLRSWLVREAV